MLCIMFTHSLMTYGLEKINYTKKIANSISTDRDVLIYTIENLLPNIKRKSVFDEE